MEEESEKGPKCGQTCTDYADTGFDDGPVERVDLVVLRYDESAFSRRQPIVSRCLEAELELKMNAQLEDSLTGYVNVILNRNKEHDPDYAGHAGTGDATHQRPDQ